MNTLPVVAAVPNYNMGEQLKELLPTLMTSGYDDIYVLDDGSTDGSRETTQEVSTDIHFIAGEQNKGAGANRNRIIDALAHKATVHFIDADTSLDTDRAAEVIRDALPSNPYGFVGGLARTNDGFQTVWNYGPRQSLWADLGAQVQSRIEGLLLTDPDKAAKLRERFSGLLADWPNPLAEPERKQVFWVVEQNMVVNSETFGAIGGFDETLREHEIQDLAIRMAHRGLKRLFDPSFAVSHKAVDVRQYNRATAMLKAEVAIARKHGLLGWLMPDGKLKPSL